MKDKFLGYYWSDEDYENEVWENGTLVVDTNVLLDIYRVSPETSEDLVKVLNAYAEKDRLWIPYQVAQEYHEDLYPVAYSQMGKFDAAYGCLKEFKDKINEKRNHPFLNEEQCQDIEKMLNNIKRMFDEQQEKLKQSIKNDSLKTRIADIFKGRVGEELSEDDLQIIREEGQQRYDKKIPPGYKDENKPDDKKYGDLIVWKQIMSYAKENQRHVIFVSNDTKEDWYLKDGSQTITPHPCLFKEFAKETEKHILIYSLELFLKTVKNRNLAVIKDGTIDELEKITKLVHEILGQFSDGNEATGSDTNVTNNFILRRKMSEDVSDTGNKTGSTAGNS